MGGSVSGEVKGLGMGMHFMKGIGAQDERRQIWAWE
ncbi:hypothetical protein KS4_11900 [Poriferisphaera corsica]|uniref:Uncharacterized protein n=1 Tax=Poriferisphaera corsica TaxID=2528020 RepID=A0A517YSD8_9BACT|nr:hypothetical protein KS4_11900 [Poriferisphaera corsica]